MHSAAPNPRFRAAAPPPLLPQAVTQQWNPQYIVKADDDVFFRLDRLPHAARQWGAMHAGASRLGLDGLGRCAELGWGEVIMNLVLQKCCWLSCTC